MLLKNPSPHIVLLFNFYVCLCVLMCMKVPVRGGSVHAAGTLMCEEARDNPQVSFFGICSSCFVETGMLWGSSCWLGKHVWVASEPQGSVGLCHWATLLFPPIFLSFYGPQVYPPSMFQVQYYPPHL